MNYTFIPCRQSNYKTFLLDGKDKKDVIDKMKNYSINVIFNQFLVISMVFYICGIISYLGYYLIIKSV
jgi:hypothetical protein